MSESSVSSTSWLTLGMKTLVAQSCPTLWDPVDCSPPGSSVHGVLQARILEWVQFSSLQSLSHVWLFVTPWTAARQASLSIANSQSLLKRMSIESVMPSNHLILSSPSPPALSLSQDQGLFKRISSSQQVDKVLEFQLQHQSFQWTTRTDHL